MEASQDGILPRQAAIKLATRRIERAITYKRWGIF